MSKSLREYHCDACGERYKSTGYETERADGMVIWCLDQRHKCPFPSATFFERTEKEYRYREGKRQEREVTYRTYSGHYIRDGSADLLAASDWKERP